MKTNVVKKLRLLGLLISIFVAGNIAAQTLEEAGELFNQGRAFINDGDNKSAIDKLTACIEMCNKVGEGADDLKKQATGVMPNLWYNYAKDLFDQGKLDESIETYKKTLEVASTYNDTEVFDKTNKVIAQLYLKSGNDKFKDRDFEAAVVELNNSLKYDTTNTNTLLLLGYSYKRLEDIPMMIAYFEKIIAIAGPNDRNAPKAAESLMNHYMITGARLLNAKNSADGLKYLDTAATYGESGDLYYYYAVGYNADQRYDDAIVAAEKALEIDPNNRENVAKYNFEIGTAWYGKKDTAKACEAYSKANFGRTSMRAESIMKQLKCK